MNNARSLSQRLTGKFLDRRPRRRALRPMAEGLEVRSLMSVGLDPTFGFGGVAQISLPSTLTNRITFEVGNIALQNGQVVAVGTEGTSTYSTGGIFISSTDNLAVGRLTTSGSVDTTFGTNGVATIPKTFSDASGTTYTLGTVIHSEDIAVQPNGQIVILDTATAGAVTDLAVVRLNANGQIDTTFGSSGFEAIPFGANFSIELDPSDSLTIQPNGKIDAVTTVDSLVPAITGEFGVAQLTTSGALDPTFNPGASAGTQEVLFNKIGGANPDAVATAVAVEPTLNAIVVVGNVSSPGITSNIGVAVLSAIGTIDGSLVVHYNSNNDDTATAVAVQGTQAVIAGYSEVQASPSFATDLTVTAVSLPTLSLDPSFAGGSGEYSLPSSLGGTDSTEESSGITYMPDGSILVGGSTSPVFGESTFGILVNLASNGVLNASYGSNGVATLPVIPSGRLLVQGDGKVIFFGEFTDNIYRTTAPVPAVATWTPPVLNLTPNGKKVTGVTIFFNTAVNPAMASNVKLYEVLVGKKGRNFIKIKRAIYNASNNSVTLQFRNASKINKKGYTVLIAASTGIVESGAGILNNGATLSIYVPPTARS